MKRLPLFLLALAFAFNSPAAKPKPAPNFSEVSELIRQHLPGVTEAELQRAAAQGWVNHFKGRVLLGDAPVTNTPANISGARVYENGFVYLRLSGVGPGLAEKLAQAYEPLAVTNKVRGLILDARYAGGTDYAAAAEVADLFLGTPQPLLDWGAGRADATAKEKPIAIPVTVLINSQTRGAAEALAAVLRHTGAGLVIGGKSAGEAAVFQKFALSDGQPLRIATETVRLGDGEPLPAGGLIPDITITVKPADERAHYADPYKVLSATTPATISTNVPRRRMNEAELVRLQREGQLPPDDQPFPSVAGRPGAEAEKPTLRDPVLARAVDVLKALAIVRPPRAL